MIQHLMKQKKNTSYCQIYDLLIYFILKSRLISFNIDLNEVEHRRFSRMIGLFLSITLTAMFKIIPE